METTKGRAILIAWMLLLLFGPGACRAPEEGPRGGTRDTGGAGVPTSNSPARVDRGAVLKDSVLLSATHEQVSQLVASSGLNLRTRYGVQIHRIVYRTIDVHGRETIASGTVTVPLGGSGPLPMVSVQHGTIVGRPETPSALGYDAAGPAFAASGYVAVVPDYLGLGESEGLHPFVHARSLASAVVDMIRAARRLAPSLGVTLGDELFLIGYSEGGYATMAAHREIEERHVGELTVTASVPMAGPYDLSGTMADLLLQDKPYRGGYYLPYLVFAYDDVYDIFDSAGTIFLDPWAQTLPELFRTGRSAADVSRAMPSVPRKILQPAFIESFTQDTNHPLRRALRENDLTEWTPRAPMLLLHCRSDDIVPIENSSIALERFRSRRAPVRMEQTLGWGHGGCAPYAIQRAREWLDSLRSS